MLNKCRVAGLWGADKARGGTLKCRIQLIALFAVLSTLIVGIPRKNKYLPSVHYPLLGRVLIVSSFYLVDCGAGPCESVELQLY